MALSEFQIVESVCLFSRIPPCTRSKTVWPKLQSRWYNDARSLECPGRLAGRVGVSCVECVWEELGFVYVLLLGLIIWGLLYCLDIFFMRYRTVMFTTTAEHSTLFREN